jgi:tRNA (mo5U34)-methyltransferase
MQNLAMDISEISVRAEDFRKHLQEVKSSVSETFPWQLSPNLGSFAHLDEILTGHYRRLLDLSKRRPIAIIGVGDGDLAFFLESLGHEVHAADYSPTNYNGLKGFRKLREILGSKINISEVDLETQFHLPSKHYDLIFFLNTLNHLQNPYYVLRSLSDITNYCLLSTRVARVTADRQVRFSDIPIAYLVAPYEKNNDPTNYWIFSEAGLHRILDRTGWDICCYGSAGNKESSDPISADNNEHAFCLVRSQK